ncbi:hypothetical protein O3P69_002379 [Scylla paramamosain]|uniref:Uncharacterized protein n=1 Tax=Scylla paramamosain TaxID=85552 RepID=A0AAW0V7X3_SCYPA
MGDILDTDCGDCCCCTCDSNCCCCCCDCNTECFNSFSIGYDCDICCVCDEAKEIADETRQWKNEKREVVTSQPEATPLSFTTASPS